MVVRSTTNTNTKIQKNLKNRAQHTPSDSCFTTGVAPCQNSIFAPRNPQIFIPHFARALANFEETPIILCKKPSLLDIPKAASNAHPPLPIIPPLSLHWPLHSRRDAALSGPCHIVKARCGAPRPPPAPSFSGPRRLFEVSSCTYYPCVSQVGTEGAEGAFGRWNA
jgi:hypothetical protein